MNAPPFCCIAWIAAAKVRVSGPWGNTRAAMPFAEEGAASLAFILNSAANIASKTAAGLAEPAGDAPAAAEAGAAATAVMDVNSAKT